MEPLNVEVEVTCLRELNELIAKNTVIVEELRRNINIIFNVQGRMKITLNEIPPAATGGM